MDDNTVVSWAEFSGANAAYLLDLYDRYTADPQAVDAPTRALLERLGPPPAAPLAMRPAAGPTTDSQRAAAAGALAGAIAAYGYRAARLDPLGSEPPGDAELLAE